MDIGGIDEDDIGGAGQACTSDGQSKRGSRLRRDRVQGDDNRLVFRMIMIAVIILAIVVFVVTAYCCDPSRHFVAGKVHQDDRSTTLVGNQQQIVLGVD